MAKTIKTVNVSGNDLAQEIINHIDKYWDERRVLLSAGDQTRIVNAVTTIIAN